MHLRLREWLALGLTVVTVGLALLRLLSDDAVHMESQTRERLRQDPDSVVSQTLQPRPAGAASQADETSLP